MFQKQKKERKKKDSQDVKLLNKRVSVDFAKKQVYTFDVHTAKEGKRVMLSLRYFFFDIIWFLF